MKGECNPLDLICKPIKLVFKSRDNDFRVLSCIPVGEAPNELQLNQYANFTLSGSNLSAFNLNEEYPISIREDTNSKYEASYIVVGFQGIDIGENITVDPEVEFKFLQGIMSHGQAINVHTVYPNFIELILNNREAEIAYKKIANVGSVYLEKYIDKIKGCYKSILFMGLANEWEIKGEAKLDKLMDEFITPEEANQAMQSNPYRVLIDVVQYGFDTADAKILQKMPDMIDSKERCEYGCLKVLKENEGEGDTRLNANILARLVKDFMPECYHHVVEVVTGNDLLYYDTKSKDVSIRKTYEQEKFIAEEILKRIDKVEDQGMDWERFRSIDGFDCTDEQVEILRMTNERSIMMLTGGPGCGKTSATVSLIKMLEHYMKSYILLAPTGIASKRLASSTGRKASTVHMFLAKLKDSISQSEYIILDEFSMVGVDLMAELLVHTPNSKIILIGDECQLASITCGNLLQDMVDSNIIPRANLTKVFRYGIGSIATMVSDTRFGKEYLKDNGDVLFHAEVQDFDFVPIESDIKKVIPQILEVYEETMNKGYTTNEIMVLSPMNKYEVGAYKINEAIQNRFNPKPYTNISYNVNKNVTIRFKIGDKCVNTRNNYKSPIMDIDENGSIYFTGAETLIANGDIGYVRSCEHDEELGDYLVMQYDENLIGVFDKDVKDLLLGYALTIHRVQGSESKAVILINHKMHQSMLTRNIIHVGASRAKEYLVQIGDVSCINEGLKKQQNKERETWLKDMLKGEAKDDNI